ncbi:hypothetical protein [Halopiger djelfimassiliensis]|uniref:hypothetical protein n=1 Tax=Halopiger djelfimassiliensis TaxID=1293047 RepID=UPI0018A7EB29|nr:hypothetical protein [Halopiger djelfimassiliensis]
MPGDDSLDRDVAAELARDQLAQELRFPPRSDRSDVAALVENTSHIAAALEEGEVPEQGDIETARYYLTAVEKCLDEITSLFGWNPWDTGATWGELTAEQQTEVYEQNHQRLGEDDESNTEIVGNSDEEVLSDRDLAVLRMGLEAGLLQVEHGERNREAAARMLERYAEAVRDGDVYSRIRN